MATPVLVGQERSDRGSSAARRLRREGWIPANVYGHGQPTRAIRVPSREARDIVRAHPPTLDLEIGGVRGRVVIKEVQHDYKGDGVLHVDFQTVGRDEKIRVAVPLLLRGTPEGVKAGGVLQQSLHQIQVECLPDAIPERIVAKIDALVIDQVLHVKDLELPAGVVAVQDGDLAVVAVHKVLLVEAEGASAVGEPVPVQPEVIGEKERLERREAKEKEDKKEDKEAGRKKGGGEES